MTIKLNFSGDSLAISDLHEVVDGLGQAVWAVSGGDGTPPDDLLRIGAISPGSVNIAVVSERPALKHALSAVERAFHCNESVGHVGADMAIQRSRRRYERAGGKYPQLRAVEAASKVAEAPRPNLMGGVIVVVTGTLNQVGGPRSTRAHVGDVDGGRSFVVSVTKELAKELGGGLFERWRFTGTGVLDLDSLEVVDMETITGAERVKAHQSLAAALAAIARPTPTGWEDVDDVAAEVARMRGVEESE